MHPEAAGLRLDFLESHSGLVMNGLRSSEPAGTAENTSEAPGYPGVISAGTFALPAGICGPLPLGGEHEPCYVPLATTEGALTASYHRGARALMQAKTLEISVEKKGDYFETSASALIPQDVVSQVLQSSPAAMYKYWTAACMGIMSTASKGANGHFANGLTAFSLACGINPAHIPQSAEGIVILREEGNDLRACVQLPALQIDFQPEKKLHDTVFECRCIAGLNSHEPEHAARMATALLLAGELSIMAAIAAGHFARAHRKLGRKK
ncbi:MAG: hypothetical protein V4543_18125 [Bacteroidota bacterium]